MRCIHGDIELETPRDRNGSFEPKFIKKGKKPQLGGFDERIVSLYARSMSTRDIQAHFEETYGVDVSPTISHKSPKQYWTRLKPDSSGH